MKRFRQKSMILILSLFIIAALVSCKGLTLRREPGDKATLAKILAKRVVTMVPERYYPELAKLRPDVEEIKVRLENMDEVVITGDYIQKKIVEYLGDLVEKVIAEVDMSDLQKTLLRSDFEDLASMLRLEGTIELEAEQQTIALGVTEGILTAMDLMSIQ